MPPPPRPWGVRISGWDTLLDMHRTALAGPLRDEHARYVVDDVVLVRPDVALAHKRAWATDPEGEPLDDEAAMRATYVLVKQDGRWWIADRSNTLIAR